MQSEENLDSYIDASHEELINCTSPNPNDAISSMSFAKIMSSKQKKDFEKSTKELMVNKNISYEFCSVLLRALKI